jgi:hypothetical protein
MSSSADLMASDASMFAEPLTLLRRDVEALFGPGVWLNPVEIWERLQSHVLRLALCPEGGATPQTHLFLKVSKPRIVGGSVHGMRLRIENDFATTVRVYSKMAHARDFGAVRPIACYSALRAIVTEEVTGETLLDRLQRQARWRPRPAVMNPLSDALTASGRWIRAFQEGGGSEEVMTPDAVRAYIDHRLAQIANATGSRGDSLRAKLLLRIDALCRLVSAVELVPVHADLSPSNVMVADDGRIVVIDFAMARLGHPMQDVARLFTQLELLSAKPQFRPVVIGLLQRALLEGFHPGLTIADPGLRLQVLAQRVNHLASLTTRRYSRLEAAYNWFVRRRHWGWLEAEAAAEGGRPTSWG